MGKKGYRQPKKVRMREITQKLIIAGLILCCVLVLLFSLYMIVKSLGKSSLQKHAASVTQMTQTEELMTLSSKEEETYELKEGEILVDGEVYRYNQDIMTFLCMGVDSRSGIAKEKTPGKAGQADALLLVVANPHLKNIRVIPINRDTMTEIEIYDTAGVLLEKERKQITLQYAYGNGREKSCELMEQAVSKLFYGIPIHGYGALDMEAIATLNDAVGGVDVTVPEDMTRFKPEWKKGTQIHLFGKEALEYIRDRDTAFLGTNIGRMERQKQYLTAFAQKIKEKCKEDITFPITLYQKIQKHMVTSLKIEEITYLADTLLGYEFSMENITGIPGESKMGEKNEEFYIDEASLKQLVLDVFYEKTELK